MLYKLGQENNKFNTIIPLPFKGLPLEKDLENLLAENLWDVLFENNELMALTQERAWQPEADIYALNKHGDLVVFELKRDQAGAGAIHQVLRYCERAAHFSYEKLQSKFRKYLKDSSLNLREEHRLAFDLEHQLDKSAFNQKQHMVVVGAAGDNQLIQNVDYWKSRGLSIDFVPYRIYKIASEYYFEFFSLPYDSHSNPAHAKGVLFDTCSSYIKDTLWYMCENSRVAAFGDQMHVVNYLNKGDQVFIYQKGKGVVAAGSVKDDKAKKDTFNGTEVLYRDLKWLSAVPERDKKVQAISAGSIKEIVKHNFFWARTIKTPYLSKGESKEILEALKSKVRK